MPTLFVPNGLVVRHSSSPANSLLAVKYKWTPEMTNRVVYAEAALWGATPNLLDSSGPAAKEIARIAAEVDAILGVRQAA